MGRVMQGAKVLVIADVRRHAQVKQNCSDIVTATTDDVEHCFMMAEKLRVHQCQPANLGDLATSDRSEETLLIGESGPRCAVPHEQFCHVLTTSEEGMCNDRFARVKVDPARISTVLQQPAHPLDVIGRCVAEKVSKCARNVLATQLVGR